MAQGRRLAAVLAAAALAVPLIISREGWRNVGYRDPVGIPTACAGSTAGAVVGRRYSDQDCEGMLAQDAVKHGLEIARCLPPDLPIEVRAAFTSAGFNLGAATFCKSSMSRKALAGDLPGACASLSLYVYAGGKRLRGLVSRRAAERALCERGLTPARRTP